MGSVTTAIQLLQVIRRQGESITKADLARSTGLSLTTISEHIDEFIKTGLVVNDAVGTSTGGRRPKLLQFNSEIGYIASIDLESTYYQVALTDFNYNIVGRKSDNIDVSSGPVPVLENIASALEFLLREKNVREGELKGIGMGVPGPVEFSTGLPASLPIMPGWAGHPVSEFLAKKFNCPCYMDNNVNIMALGEATAGIGKGIDNFIFVKLGNGIGAGIVCDGGLYRGFAGSAGDIGHINIGHDQLCYCGNRGCLEAISGGRAIIAQAEQFARNGESKLLQELLVKNGRLFVSDVIHAVQSSDPIVTGYIKNCCSYIGGVLAGIVNFFNPAMICIGGGYSQIGDIFLSSLRQVIYDRALPVATRNLFIQQSSLGENAAIVGAAVMTIDELITRGLIINS